MSKKKKNIINKNCLTPKVFFGKLSSSFKKIKLNKLNFKLTPLRLGILITFLVMLLIYLFRSVFFAAFVNGKPILRSKVLLEAEKQTGNTILENLIERQLIFDQARKENIKIDDKTVSEEIEGIKEMLKAQNISLEEALALSKQDMNSLKEQIKIQKIVEKILGDKISISEEEIKEYFDKNKEYFGDSAKLEEVEDQIKEELFNQKLSTEYINWIDKLKENAKIKYIVNY